MNSSTSFVECDRLFIKDFLLFDIELQKTLESRANVIENMKNALE